MKTNIIIITLMIVSSMIMVSTAENTNGTFEIDDTVENIKVDVTVDFDADEYPDSEERYDEGFIYRWNGEYAIKGTVELPDEYNVDATAKGHIYTKDDTLIYCNLYDIDGKAYQTGEYQYLYKDTDYKYYGYLESGYSIGGDMEYSNYVNPYFKPNLTFDEYSKYIITRSKPIGQFTLSSPYLGVNMPDEWYGYAKGDLVPILYTYRDTNTWKKITSETFPEGHTGPVIVTPVRIAGEPLVPTGFWDTPKGQRILLWKANAA